MLPNPHANLASVQTEFLYIRGSPKLLDILDVLVVRRVRLLEVLRVCLLVTVSAFRGEPFVVKSLDSHARLGRWPFYRSAAARQLRAK